MVAENSGGRKGMRRRGKKMGKGPDGFTTKSSVTIIPHPLSPLVRIAHAFR